MSDPKRPARRLTRSTSDRVVLGVAGGLGRYFGIDPVIFRIGFVVLTLASGSGILLYLLGWLLLPEDDGTESVGTRATRGWSPVQLVLIIGLVVIAIPALAGAALFGPNLLGGIGLPLLILAAVVLFLLRDQDDERSPAVPVETPAAAAPPAPPAPPAPRAPRRPRGPSVTRITLSLLLVAAGVAALADEAGAFDVSVEGFLAFALVVVGLGLVAGSRLGRRRGRRLIPLGVLLVLVNMSFAAGDVRIGGGVGERSFRPATLAEVEDEYRLFAGEMIVDLSELDLPPGEPLQIEASIVFGELNVRVPFGAAVDVDAEVGAGQIVLFGEELSTGLGADERRTYGGTPGGGRIELELDVSAGEINVQRVPRAQEATA